MAEIKLRSFTPADRDWLVDQHGRLYASDEGFDGTFGPLVATILDDYIAAHDPSRETGWIAQQGATRLGSIFCVALTPSTAKLRLFLLVPEARGKGLGKRMLATCMGFARDRGYTDMQLWTHRSHEAAGALYKAAGWSLDRETAVTSFGQDLIEQEWTVRL